MLIVVKIGGSCITYKREGIPKIRYDFLSFFVQEIKRFQKNNSNIQIVIVHGGGSITHPLVDYYNIGDDLRNEKVCDRKSQISTAKLHLAMNNLNNDIVSFFLKKNLNAWPIQTSAVSHMDSSSSPCMDFATVKCALNNDVVPVLHGDVVLNSLYKMSIFSGDQVACILARDMCADHLIFFTDVNGVYDWYESEKCHGDVIKDLQVNDRNVNFSSKKRDHSGGMSSKISYIKEYCSNVKKISICNGLIDKNISDVFVKGDNVGTNVNV